MLDENCRETLPNAAFTNNRRNFVGDLVRSLSPRGDFEPTSMGPGMMIRHRSKEIIFREARLKRPRIAAPSDYSAHAVFPPPLRVEITGRCQFSAGQTFDRDVLHK